MTIELVDVDANIENNPPPPQNIEPQESHPAHPAHPSTPEAQEEQAEPEKKGRGRPKGSPNKPKAEPKPEPKPKRKARLPDPESESESDEPLEPPPRPDKIPKPRGIDAVPVDHLLKERMQAIHARAHEERTQRQNQYMQMLSEKLR